MQVLQLDLCAFTEFSQKMSPMQLAHALHHIFSSFDKVVQGVNFFKMDTVGDVQGGEAGGLTCVVPQYLPGLGLGKGMVS